MARAKHRYLGLDIGHHTLKAVEVEGTGAQNWAVTGVGMAPTPPDAIADGVVAQPEVLSTAIHDLLRHNSLNGRHVVLSVCGPAVNFRPIRLPRMKDNQLRKAVLFKARESQTTIPVEELVIEYDVQDSDPSVPDLDIMMVAAPRAIVESRTDAVSSAGLLVEAVDMDGFAMMRALVDFNPDPEVRFKTVAIVCLGHTYTEFNIVTRGSFSFPRSIPIGGSHLNGTLRSSLGLDLAAVEEMKHLMDVRPLLANDLYTANSSPEQLLRPALDELVREITRSINYYQSQFGDANAEGGVDAVLLCGGGARMNGIEEYMRSRLRQEVYVADPLAPFFESHPSPELDLVRDQSPALVSALGLALYELAGK